MVNKHVKVQIHNESSRGVSGIADILSVCVHVLANSIMLISEPNPCVFSQGHILLEGVGSKAWAHVTVPAYIPSYLKEKYRQRCQLMSQSRSSFCRDPNNNFGIRRHAWSTAGSVSQQATESLTQLLPLPAQPNAPVSAQGAAQRTDDWQSVLCAQSGPEN